jgi:2-polyprenyl-3-methyl-5-hydroxy-6-metoxy-1,4-benzoquinol methylase
MSTKGYRSTAYQRYEHFERPDYPRLAASYRRRLSRHIAPRPEWRCLDLACGQGNFLGYLAACGAQGFHGVDGSEAATAVACAVFGNDRVSCMDVFAFLRADAAAYDLISALDFIEHISKDELFDLLSLVSTRLRPRGKFLLRTPNAAGLFGMASRYNDITHELCFTPTALGDVLVRGGLRPLAVWEDTGTPTSIMQAVHWLTWEAARFAIRCVDAAETGMWGDGVLTRNMWALAERT